MLINFVDKINIWLPVWVYWDPHCHSGRKSRTKKTFFTSTFYFLTTDHYLNNVEEIWLSINVLFLKKRTWDNESFKLPESKCIWVWSTLRKQNLKENRGHLNKTANNTEKEFQLFEESKCNEKYEVQNAVMVPVLLPLI